jgi:hypothetical protein
VKPAASQIERPFDVIINATAASLSADVPPVPAAVFATHAGFGHDVRQTADCVHGIRRQHGAQVRDGLGMLVEQAAEAFACGAACDRRRRHGTDAAEMRFESRKGFCNVHRNGRFNRRLCASWLKWIILGPIAGFLLVQLYFFANLVVDPFNPSIDQLHAPAAFDPARKGSGCQLKQANGCRTTASRTT